VKGLHSFDGEQRRRRRFTFGVKHGHASLFHIQGEAFEPVDELPTVVSTGQADWKGSAQRNRATIEYMATAQGIDPARFEHTPFTTTELRRAIANGVPLPMGRAVARAVKAATTEPLKNIA
jgi:site-specific DNA-cytosine methylase